jgi:hypothetical protein
MKFKSTIVACLGLSLISNALASSFPRPASMRSRPDLPRDTEASLGLAALNPADLFFNPFLLHKNAPWPCRAFVFAWVGLSAALHGQSLPVSDNGGLFSSVTSKTTLREQALQAVKNLRPAIEAYQAAVVANDPTALEPALDAFDSNLDVANVARAALKRTSATPDDPEAKSKEAAEDKQMTNEIEAAKKIGREANKLLLHPKKKEKTDPFPFRKCAGESGCVVGLIEDALHAQGIEIDPHLFSVGAPLSDHVPLGKRFVHIQWSPVNATHPEPGITGVSLGSDLPALDSKELFSFCMHYLIFTYKNYPIYSKNTFHFLQVLEKRGLSDPSKRVLMDNASLILDRRLSYPANRFALMSLALHDKNVDKNSALDIAEDDGWSRGNQLRYRKLVRKALASDPDAAAFADGFFTSNLSLPWNQNAGQKVVEGTPSKKESIHLQSDIHRSA